MLTGNWLEIGKLNTITVVIDEQRIILESTLGQVERYLELAKKRTDEEGKPEQGLLRAIADAVDVVEVILNPDPANPKITRERIQQKVDIDQMKLIIQTWVERKLYVPRLEPDPILAPEKGR